MQENFDVYISDLPKSEPTFHEWKTNLEYIPNNERLILILGESKEKACVKMKEINFLGGDAKLLPTIYRFPKISCMEARNFASIQLEEKNILQNTKLELGKTVETYAFWWRFKVGEEIIEGNLPTFDISFLDGHLVIFKERVEWIRLSDC